ncbi:MULTISPECIES: DUF1376 domain-containing protein [unclassified Bartonella]|uniref:YdaU family protein n=1 Tax=unclassified Bartonella TaxID=2645622 RepID=UPI00235DEFE5|nr:MULTISPECIES: DUF1376 domain-containing protein [unclassified Bartonella]
MKHAHHQETPHYESSRLPYVCWYQNDFLGGVRGMRAHEIGIYTILLNEMYARGRPLELSVERLARLCGCDKRTFVNVLEMLIEEGKILNLANGLWNKRCETVFQEREKLLEQKSFAGHCSAKKRKQINAEFAHLRKGCARDDEQNSKAQNREEKETPYGVSEKKFLLITAKEERAEEKACSSLNSFPISSETSLPLKQQDATENFPLPADMQSTPHSPTSRDTPLLQESPTTSLITHTASTTSAAFSPKTTILDTSSQSLTPPEDTQSSRRSSSKNRSPLTSMQEDHTTTSNVPPPPISCAPVICTTDTSNTRSKAKSGTALPKGHRLPSDWQADIDAAIVEGLSEEQARWQEKKFRDYWHAKSGKDALKVDWQATWRNWFRREIERIKEHQERLAIFSSHSRPSQPNKENEALYRSLINYHANEHEHNF